MKNEQLKAEFNDAVNFINHYTESLPADFLLKLYAYYRIATKNNNSPGSQTPLINAFKANALIQAKNTSANEAMQSYIDMVKNELPKN